MTLYSSSPLTVPGKTAVSACGHRALIGSSSDQQCWPFPPGAPAGGTANTVDLAPYLTDTSGASGLVGPNARAWSDTTNDCGISGGLPTA